MKRRSSLSTVALFLLAIGAAVARAAEKGPEPIALETRAHLKALLRLDTSNPPGNELPAAKYLKAQLDREGVPAQIFTSSGTRSSLVARLKGSGAKRPLILMCHTDVVPAEGREWSTDPFTPTEREGYLYGRGAADIKCMCAAELSVILWLKRSKAALARDVIFFAEADEENGGRDRHIDWLMKEHGDALQAEFAINEGGNTIWDNGRVSEIRIQAAEKEYMDLRLIARGSSGHASVPRSDNAVAALARAVARLSEHRSPARLEAVVRAFLERQAQAAAAPLGSAIAEVLAAAPGRDLDRAADGLSSLDPEFGAMLRDTLSATMLKAGYKSNVIPAEAEATFNARLLPGRKPQEFVAELNSVIDDPAVEIRFDPPSRPAVGAMPTDTDLYRAAIDAARELSPQARVTPFLSAWTTDSQDLRARGVLAYGLDPPLTEEDGRRIHGRDERIALEALDWYARYLRMVVLKLAGPVPGGKAPQGH